MLRVPCHNLLSDAIPLSPPRSCSSLERLPFGALRAQPPPLPQAAMLMALWAAVSFSPSLLLSFSPSLLLSFSPSLLLSFSPSLLLSFSPSLLLSFSPSLLLSFSPSLLLSLSFSPSLSLFCVSLSPSSQTDNYDKCKCCFASTKNQTCSLPCTYFPCSHVILKLKA